MSVCCEPTISESSDSILRAIASIRCGRVIIMVDDEDRENEGDFVMAAQDATPEAINFMARHGRGLICVPMDGADLDRLGLPMMVEHNTAAQGTAFTVSVDAAFGITTGISAADRAHTIRLLASPEATGDSFASPGHVFPLRYQEGGVLVRAGHTEGSVDLAKLAGKRPVSVICEIMNEDGTMARRPQLEEISRKYDIPIVSVADLISYRLGHEQFIERVVETRMPTRHGEFRAIAYRSKVDPGEHVALVRGEINPENPTLVRVHSACLTGDVFGSARCECGEQLDLALQAIAAEESGVFVYMRPHGGRIAESEALSPHVPQNRYISLEEAAESLGCSIPRLRVSIGAQILADLGVRSLRLLTNDPKNDIVLSEFRAEIIDTVPLGGTSHAVSRSEDARAGDYLIQ